MKDKDLVHRYIRSAGQTFLGLQMEEIILRFSELRDTTKKNYLIRNIYENQHGFYDKNISGTRIRVEAAIRIIAAGSAEYALKLIADNDNPRVLAKAKLMASVTLLRIQTGKVQLPNLSNLKNE